MRKILFTLLAIMATIAVNAGRVSKQEALQKAQHFMPNKQFEEAKAFARSDQSSESEPFYIFNVGNKGGYVIVSGDDRITDILGYSDYGELDIDKAPTNLKWLLECFQQLIDSLAQKPGFKAKARTRGSSASRVAIEPLITTHWGQEAPYNIMCPKIGDQRCLTGCVATAMAQIINYHQWPKGQTSAVGAYTTTTSGISMPQLEPTSFDWDNMTDDDIARLMLYCGQSVQMDFGLTESGAINSPVETIKNVFGYSKAVSSYMGLLFSTDHLEELVYKELAENRPVFYTGTNSSVGHAFVVDGYQNGMFHINWGWNGDQDGYFVLTGLTEDVMPFPLSYNTNVLFGIGAPASDVNRSDVIVTECTTETRSVYRKNVSDDFVYNVVVNSTLLSDFEDVSYDLCYGLFDENGLIKVYSQQQKIFPMEGEMFHGDFTINSDIPVGTYRIMPMYRHKENEAWKKASGANLWQLTIYVGEQSLYIKGAIDEWDGKYEEYGAHEINGVTYKLSKEFENYWAYVLPYQLTGKYSGSVTVPNTIEYKGNTYFVKENLFNSFVDCENLTHLSLALETNISIFSCPNLVQLEVKQGNSINISNCPLLESIDLPVTMSDPWIDHCSNLKTIKVNCRAVKWGGQVNWSDESLPELTDVYFPLQVPPPVDGGDVVANSNARLHVPKGSLSSYQTSQWKSWNVIDDLPPENFTFGYCHNETVGIYGMATGTVCGDNNEELAMRIPAKELSTYIGCQITNIQVYSPERSRNDWGYENYEYVFITKPGTDYLVKQPFKVLRGAWNTIELKEPYTITGEDLFVGIGRHGQLGLMYENDTFVADALWRRIIGDDDSLDEALYGMGLERRKWDFVKACCKKEKGPSALFAHPWPIKFAIEGESVPQGVVIRELDLADEGNAVTSRTRAAGSGVQIKGAIRNRSQEIVKSYTVEWSIDGGEKQSKSFETLLYPNESETIIIDLPSTLQSGNHTVSTNVTLVNNVKNGLEGCNMPTIELNDGNVSLDSLLGDVNCDSEVNEADLHEVVNFIMGIPSDFFFKEVADMNEDDEVNAADVVLIVDKFK